MIRSRSLVIAMGLIILSTLACNLISKPPAEEVTAVPPSPTIASSPTTPIVDRDPSEPVLIKGQIPFTSPFFLNTISEPFVLLEDEAGFVQRDLRFEFPLASQVMGHVEMIDDSTLSYSLTLPSLPQGTLVDVDQDGQEDQGLMVFAVAYWSNTWGDPFLERRDGTGWSTAYTSAITDPNQDDEIIGGTLLIWSPDDEQDFPSGFGRDGMLFTEDDPITPVPPGYSIVNLDQEPFRIFKEPQPEIDLLEGVVAVNDYSDLSYEEAFDALFEKASREYPFSEEKGIDWEGLYDQFSDRVQAARNDEEYYRAIKDFTFAIPDGHVGASFNAEVFIEDFGGGFGMVLTELTDGRVIVTQVLPGYPAADAGIEQGAEILSWDGTPIQDSIDTVQPFFGPYSTDHHRRMDQVRFRTRTSPNGDAILRFRNPGSTTAREVNLEAAFEYESLFASLPSFSLDELALPIESEILDESGLAYIRITTFSDDYNLLARIWDRTLDELITNEIPGLIIDLRINSGGSSALAMDFAGYLFDEEMALYQRSYYNQRSEKFEVKGLPTRIMPGPITFEAPVAVLVGPACASACEGFAYALSQGGRALILGHYPTAGLFGEVGRGQYELPGDISMQFPTGRPETLGGDLLLEGVGVVPDVIIPVTEGSAQGRQDTVLDAAVEALLEQINR